MKKSFVCSACHYKTNKWQGKCFECNEWNTFVDEDDFQKSYTKKSQNIIDVISSPDLKRKTLSLNWPEFERVLGDGLQSGSMNLLAGEPGVGKSTLIIEILKRLNDDKKYLYVSGEESVEQTGQRAKRLDLKNKGVYFLSENDLTKVLSEIESLNPELVIIDSIQTLVNPEVLSPAGSIGQVKEITNILMAKLKERGITCIIIGHISKDGSIAGPKVMEHLVDVVLYFEGGGQKSLRNLKCKKNRFGTVDEVGMFKMTSNGLSVYDLNQSIEALSQAMGLPGHSISIQPYGARPLIYDIQSLVVKTNSQGRRVGSGIDNARLTMLVAILEKVKNIALTEYDIYVDVCGDTKKAPRSTDLAIIVSIYSAFKEAAIPPQFLSGQVGLTGEVKQIELDEANLPLPYKRLLTVGEIESAFTDKAC